MGGYLAELTFSLALPRDGGVWTMKGAVPLQGVTAVMGPSGSGKTTLLRMLAGLEPGARGEVRFGEIAWTSGRHMAPPEARRVGFVFQEGRLFRHLTVTENIAFGARRRAVPPSAMHGIADALGLGPLMHRRPATLSGGESRRVALARALASGPDILFLDEPLSGLDDDAKAQVLPYLARTLAEAGLPAIYVTHARSEATRLADRILLIENGRIAGWGAPPVQLQVTVLDAKAAHIIVDLGGTRIALQGHARPGDARRIVLPEDGALLSRERPGASGALAVIAVKVKGVIARPSGPTLLLSVAGQEIGWSIPSASELSDRLPDAGQTLHLSVLRAFLR